MACNLNLALTGLYEAGLPDSMNKLAKCLTMLFVFLCICLLFPLFFYSTNDGLA